jgi:type I restriction enzyme S subunit
LEYGKGLRGYQEADGPYRVYGTNGPISRHAEALCHSEGVVIGRKGAYRGVHYAPEPFFVIDTAFYLQLKVPLSMKWAYYEVLRNDVNSMDSGSAIPSTSRDSFYTLPVCEPPKAVCDSFEVSVAPLFARGQAAAEESSTLAALRDALLPKLLSGEIRVEHANKDLQEIT